MLTLDVLSNIVVFPRRLRMSGLMFTPEDCV